MKHTYRSLGFEHPDDVLDATEQVSERVIDHRRWAVSVEYVFRHDGKLYITRYERPATENQETDRWAEGEPVIYDAEEVMVKTYKAKKD